jgi:hypothetical protein
MNEPKLEFAFTIRLDFGDRLRIGPKPWGGLVGFVSVAGGTVSGPRFNGRVVPFSGGDYANIRNDGVVDLNAHYLLEADDGTLIYMRNTGYIHTTAPLIGAEGAMTPPVQNQYFRVTPKFETPVGPHEWLGKTVIVGMGERKTDPDHSLFHYYILL